MVEIVVTKGHTVTPDSASGLFVVYHGELSIAANSGAPAAIYSAGDHFGEENLMSAEPKSISFTAVHDTTVYFIPSAAVDMIPLVHWRLRDVRN